MRTMFDDTDMLFVDTSTIVQQFDAANTILDDAGDTLRFARLGSSSDFESDDDTILDDAGDTRRFARLGSNFDFDFEAPTDPDATSIYDLTPTPVPARSSQRRRRQLRDTRANVLRLRDALADGWDIGPELAHEEQRLAALEASAHA